MNFTSPYNRCWPLIAEFTLFGVDTINDSVTTLEEFLDVVFDVFTVAELLADFDGDNNFD